MPRDMAAGLCTGRPWQAPCAPEHRLSVRSLDPSTLQFLDCNSSTRRAADMCVCRRVLPTRAPHCIAMQVESKYIFVSNGKEMATKARELAKHFETQGTPVMMGGGNLAFTLLGICWDEDSGDCRCARHLRRLPAFPSSAMPRRQYSGCLLPDAVISGSEVVPFGCALLVGQVPHPGPALHR